MSGRDRDSPSSYVRDHSTNTSVNDKVPSVNETNMKSELRTRSGRVIIPPTKFKDFV